jgi:ribosomal protein S18 acetylase RimI-like enzyme
VVVQDILPAYYDAVLRIAASSFVYSRFHLDPAIPKETAHKVKRAWVNSYIHKMRGERLLVALLDGKPVGFLAVLATPEPGRVIDLIGVDRAYQGRGVGRALVSFFIADSADRYPLLRVGTQVANVPSMRLYESLGFRIDETAYVLHAHVNAEAPGAEAPGAGARCAEAGRLK